LARLLRVLAAIIAEPGLNPLELADRAGVSDRTLRRDLAQLRDLGYEVLLRGTPYSTCDDGSVWNDTLGGRPE